MDTETSYQQVKPYLEKLAEIEDLKSKLLRAVKEGCEWKRKYEESEARSHE